MKYSKLLVFVLLALFSVSAVYAASVSYSDTISLSQTNWNSTVTIPKFDSSLGTLTSIEFSLIGFVSGSTAFENLDASPATVTTNLSAMLKLTRPDSSTLVISLPVANTSDYASEYDGITDFNGTSGKTYSNLSASATESFISTLASDFALFTGTGNIILPVTATGTSSGSGAGNLLLQFTTNASADVFVKYNYEPDVIPEPASIVALLGGIAGIGGVALKRRFI
ncbi:MAG: choice-of-anchor E domain-containing protein [Armatimonadota bacterium]